MFKKLLPTGTALFLLSLLLFFYCNLPSNLLDDPNNCNVGISILDPASGVIMQDQQVTYLVDVFLPKHATTITVKFGRGMKDTLFVVPNIKQRNNDTFYVKCTYPLAGTDTVVATATMTNGSSATAQKIITITPKQLGVKITTSPVEHVVKVNTVDTMKFSAATNPPGGNIQFTIKSDTPIDTNRLIMSVAGNDAVVMFKADSARVYTITCITQSGNSYDSVKVKINAIEDTVIDTIPPVITRLNPEKDTVTVNKKEFLTGFSVFDTSGISSITFKLGNKVITDTSSGDGIIKCTVSGLTQGKTDTLTVTAIDRSTKKNSTSIQLGITCDTTIADAAASITKQPLGATVIEGLPVTFSIQASGTNLVYQWQRGTGDITGENEATYNLATTSMPDNNATFRCIVSNSAGKDTSQAATLTVLPKPAAPAISSITPGNASVVVSWTEVTGATSYTLYYKHGATVDTSVTTKVSGLALTQTVIGLTNGTSYAFAVNAVNANGKSALSAIRTATPQVSVAGAPTLNAPTPGVGNVTLIWSEISGATSYNVYYQTGNLTTLNKSTATKVPVATGLTTEISTLTGCQVYTFGVSSVNAGGESDIGTLQTGTPKSAAPTTTPPPATSVTCEGTSVSIPVVVSATGGTVTYQWLKGGTEISTSTNATANAATLVIANPSLADAGTYSCSVRNGCSDAVTSDGCVLSVNRNTTSGITITNGSNPICSGGSLTLTCTNGGTGPFTYQWKRSGSNVGINAATFTVQSAGTYTCTVTGACGGAVTSNEINVTQNAATSSTISNSSGTTQLCPGSSINLTCAGSGAGNLSYQWKRDGSPVGTNATLAATVAGVYTCEVTGTCGPVTSNSITLTAAQPTVTPGITATPSTICPKGDTATLAISGGTLGTNATWKWYSGGFGTTLVGSGPTIRMTPNVATTYYLQAEGGTCDGGAKQCGSVTVNMLTVKDTCGNVYHTVKIGSQVWTVENLRTTKYNDGTDIQNLTSGSDWAYGTNPGYCFYNNTSNTDTITKFGALYNSYAVNTGKLVPAGWHVPTNAEWITLSNYLGGESVAGGKMKETGTTHWSSPNLANNSSGFTALPAGSRETNSSMFFGMFFGMGGTCNFRGGAGLKNDSESLSLFSSGGGFSVRLVRN